MLYATKFKINANIPNYRMNHSNYNSESFFLINDEIPVDECHKDQISFLHDTIYELTSQKEILQNCEYIINICNLVINTLTLYEKIFNLLYVAYLIMKRIYFTFPQFRKHIEDSLAAVLCDLCLFTEGVRLDLV